MDFSFSDEQTTIRDLARGILEKEVTADRVKQVEEQPQWFDEALWSTLAEAGLLGLAVEPELGGMGYGLGEVVVLLEELGRVVAPAPALATMVLGGLPVAEFGTDAQKQEWLTPMAAGEAVLTAGLIDAEPASDGTPGTRASKDGSSWVINGRKLLVPAAHLAARCLVPAATDAGVGIFLVDPEVAGVTLTRNRTSTGEPVFSVDLDGVRVEEPGLLGGEVASGGEGLERVEWIHDRALVATCAMQLGVCERALEMTAAYVTEREQFGVPIGTFQAVQHRSADAYIDLNAMRWTMWRAAWRLAQGRPASRDAAMAKFWAAEGGARITTSAQHLHGGMGVDVDYPIHRYLLWSKALELSLGGAMPQLVRLGQDMARATPQETA